MFTASLKNTFLSNSYFCVCLSFSELPARSLRFGEQMQFPSPLTHHHGKEISKISWALTCICSQKSKGIVRVRQAVKGLQDHWLLITVIITITAWRQALCVLQLFSAKLLSLILTSSHLPDMPELKFFIGLLTECAKPNYLSY